MSARTAAYQTQITGQTGQAYIVNGVKFDGYTDGMLLDAKGPGYATFLTIEGPYCKSVIPSLSGNLSNSIMGEALSGDLQNYYQGYFDMISGSR